MMEKWCTADVFITNNKKEDTTVTTNKRTKLTFTEAMTIINNTSTENKIEITGFKDVYYVIKIDDTNYIVYVPDNAKPHIKFTWLKGKLQLNTRDTYNFTVVSKSPGTLWNVEIDNYTNMEDDYYHLIFGLNINIDILYDLVDTPNNIEIDDKKARSMLTKARFTGRLYELFGGYGYTINNNNIIWYIPDDYYINNNDINKKLYDIMINAYSNDQEGILDHLDRDQIDIGNKKDELTLNIDLNIHVVSDKKVFDTDFIICINDNNKDQKILAYIHTNTKNNTICQK